MWLISSRQIINPPDAILGTDPRHPSSSRVQESVANKSGVSVELLYCSSSGAVVCCGGGLTTPQHHNTTTAAAAAEVTKKLESCAAPPAVWSDEMTPALDIKQCSGPIILTILS